METVSVLVAICVGNSPIPRTKASEGGGGGGGGGGKWLIHTPNSMMCNPIAFKYGHGSMVYGHYPVQYWHDLNRNPRNKFQWHFKQDITISIKQREFESVVGKMADILSQTQTVKSSEWVYSFSASVVCFLKLDYSICICFIPSYLIAIDSSFISRALNFDPCFKGSFTCSEWHIGAIVKHNNVTHVYRAWICPDTKCLQHFWYIRQDVPPLKGRVMRSFDVFFLLLFWHDDVIK